MKRKAIGSGTVLWGLVIAATAIPIETFAQA